MNRQEVLKKIGEVKCDTTSCKYCVACIGPLTDCLHSKLKHGTITEKEVAEVMRIENLKEMGLIKDVSR